jgi:hypothetical protein
MSYYESPALWRGFFFGPVSGGSIQQGLTSLPLHFRLLPIIAALLLGPSLCFRIAGNKTKFSIFIDNQRFILRDSCGILLLNCSKLPPKFIFDQLPFLLPTRCGLLPVICGPSG